MNLQALKNKIKELEEEVERLERPESVWVPEVGDDHWRVGATGTVGHFEFNLYQDGLIDHHNSYQTRKLAEKASIMQRQFNMIAQACLHFDPDLEPDRSDENQAKYGFYYNPINHEWETRYTWTIVLAGAYVSTQEIAQKVVAYLNSRRLSND
jgi:hypothetical protein